MTFFHFLFKYYCAYINYNLFILYTSQINILFLLALINLHIYIVIAFINTELRFLYYKSKHIYFHFFDMQYQSTPNVK